MIIEEAEAAASFFPTPNEVVRAVQFVRENPAVVLGVVVGITSLSVARYYEGDEEEEGQVVATQAQDESDTAFPMSQPSDGLPKKLTRSSRSSTLTVCGSSVVGTPSSETIEATEASLEREPQDQEVNEICKKMSKNCSFCNQAKDRPDGCCDPDWGWFIPTCADDERHHHEHHHGGAHAA